MQRAKNYWTTRVTKKPPRDGAKKKHGKTDDLMEGCNKKMCQGMDRSNWKSMVKVFCLGWTWNRRIMMMT